MLFDGAGRNVGFIEYWTYERLRTGKRSPALVFRFGARRLLRLLRWLAAEPQGGLADGDAVNFEDFADKIARYRGLGTTIGDKVRFLGDVDGVNPHLVEVGDFSVVGKGSVLLAHCPVNGARPVKIGKFVYIGYGAIILPGVSIGDFCLVGAGAVVTKSAPEASILAGNPARIIRSLSASERSRIERMLRGGHIFGWDVNSRAERS